MKDGGVIREGFSPEVDELRDIVHGGKGFLAQMEAKLREETGIRNLKVGFNRVFGYYIEVSRSFTGEVPAGFVRKQTLANAERYITDDLKQLENKILGASERLLVLEGELFDGLLFEISASSSASSPPRPRWQSWMCSPRWRRWRRSTTMCRLWWTRG